MEAPCDFVNRHQQTCPNYSDSMNPFSSDSFKGYTNLVNQSIQANTINRDMGNHQHYNAMNTSSFAPGQDSSSNIFTISFGDPNPPLHETNMEVKENMGLMNEFHGSMEVPQRVCSTSRNHRQAQEHVFAERKRREKISQRFISLYTLLPQLKKMDKATVLEDASNYIIELQKQVKELEEIIQMKGKHIPLERRSKFCGGDAIEDNASSSQVPKPIHSNNTNDPEIVVKILRTSTVLVRIYCQRNPSLVSITLNEMERLHLAVISSNVLPFSRTDLVITITAKMSEEVLMTAVDLVGFLQSALRNFV